MQAAEEHAGQQVRCPGCQGIVRVPEAGRGARSQPFQESESAPRPRAAGLGGGEGTGDEPRRPCPMCGEMILASAVKCRFCGEVFDPALRRAEERKRRGSGPSDENLSAGEIIFAILCNGIACIIGIIWMIQGKPKGTKMFILAMIITVIGLVLQLALRGGRL
jgi:hypothetical protein